MITLAQRITELRTQKGMSRPELSLALGLPKTAVEKFGAGRDAPTPAEPRNSPPRRSNRRSSKGTTASTWRVIWCRTTI